MEAYIFRHGETSYQQGKVCLSEAHDLTPEGISTVNNSSSELAKKLDPSLPVQIHSSPFGRCLHTAKVIKDNLERRGIKALDIIGDDLIEEIRNFEWELFCPLVNGGEIEFEGDKFEVDKSLTNPQNLSSVRYLREDLAHKLAEEARKTLPPKYLRRIASFERYLSAVNRLNTKVNSLRNRNGEIQILSTHEGLTGRFIEQLSGQKEAFLGRGKYFYVRTEGGIIVPETYQEGAIRVER